MYSQVVCTYFYFEELSETYLTLFLLFIFEKFGNFDQVSESGSLTNNKLFASELENTSLMIIL